jgi:hypothetical protein
LVFSSIYPSGETVMFIHPSIGVGFGSRKAIGFSRSPGTTRVPPPFESWDAMG